MKLAMASLLAAFSAVSAQAAEPADFTSGAGGFYVGTLLGWADTAQQDTASPVWDNGFDGGATFGVFGGYRFARTFGPGSLRTELELSGRSSKTDLQDGSLHENAVFWNTLYDFDQGGQAKVAPYLGMGVGYGELKFDGYRTAAGQRLNDKDGVWGAQLVAGVSYSVSPRVRLFTDIRYRHWDDAEVTDSTGSKQKIGIDATSFNLGMAYQF